MIYSFRSKAVELFWTSGQSYKLPVDNAARLRRQLLALDAASRPEDMNLPGFKFHGLNSKPKRWSVWVTGNYRLTFGWQDGNAVDVDVEDYH
jgi:proteic killer suppression protein